ncbi:MAG: hypothetical protein KDB03_15875 [Planctomycetales bacterium]|nr:hypothetical protein [Planctomycetales bacterium]
METPSQPLLPQFRLYWFFVVVPIVAGVIWIIRIADQGQALAMAVTLTSVFLGFFALLSMGIFAIAYVLGTTEAYFVEDVQLPSSPFIDGRLPDQIIPPTHADGE